jgi:hypothetical protein
MKFNGTSWSALGVPSLASVVVNSASDIWLAGAQIEHFNGLGWSVADGFGCVPSPAFATLDGFGSTLWAAGRQLSAGLIPLTVRKNAQSCAAFSYCTSSSTSNGCHPAISGVGVPSATASSGFAIRVDGVEGQKQGLLFYGVSGQQALPWATGSTSYLCVKTPTQRLNAQSTGGTFAQCNGALVEDWHAFMSSHPSALGNPRSVGATFDAQGWFRDPPAPKTTNTSDALHFTLAP